VAGQDVESDRRHSRLLPIWWHDSEPPYLETTLLFPLWFERKTPDTTTRFFSLLYGYVDGPELRTDYVLPPIFWLERSHDGSYRQSGVFLLWNDKRQGEQYEFTFIRRAGHGPARGDGPAAGGGERARPRAHVSRRIELLNILGIIRPSATRRGRPPRHRLLTCSPARSSR
jgi:hypothetical protein